MTELQEKFLEVFDANIKREGASELRDWLVNGSDFLRAPASTRYHGAYDYGLIDHSLAVWQNLQKLVTDWGFAETWTEETIAISALLHDVCKANFYKKSFRNVKVDGQWTQKEVFEIDEKFPCGHGEKSVIILQNFMKLTPEEIYAIRAHMGGFDTSVKGGDYFIGKIFERSKLALLLNIADMTATYLQEK